jgi:CRP/FNR family transcriptional regulator
MANRGLPALQRVPLFEGLSRRQLKRIQDLAKEVRYMEGVSIVKENEAGNSFYVILEGQAKVLRGSRTITKLVPGDFFGEISLLDGGARSASVVSETPMTLLELTQRAFQRLLRDDPSVALKLMEALAKRVRRTERSVQG